MYAQNQKQNLNLPIVPHIDPRKGPIQVHVNPGALLLGEHIPLFKHGLFIQAPVVSLIPKKSASKETVAFLRY